jgi:hypothetical protein
MSDEQKALKAAREKLEDQTGLYVGAAYGYAEDSHRIAEEFLIIYSDDKGIEFPAFFEGFKVIRRNMPRAL